MSALQFDLFVLAPMAGLVVLGLVALVAHELAVARRRRRDP